MLLDLASMNVYVLVSIYGFLLVATLITWLLSSYRPDRNFGEVKARIKSWWTMLSLFSVAILFHHHIALVFLAFVCFLALKEYLSLTPTRRTDRRILFWVYLAIPIQFFWVFKGFYGMFIMFIPVYMFLFLPLRMVLNGETKGFLKAVGTVQWGLMLTVFCLSHMAYLLVLPLDVNHIPFLQVAVDHSSSRGAGLLLYLAMLTQFNDVFQFLCGKAWGKHAIVPKVSPKKTWEGLIGALLLTVLLSAAVGPLLTPMGWLGSVCAGLIISISGFFGDVTLSALKRDLGIKDSGSLIPGHGGILDRVDSLIFTAPLFFHFIRFFYF